MGRQVTGVERYAREVTSRLASPHEILTPARRAEGAAGHLWEQVVLPRRAPRGSLLWSPCNFGPVRHHRQVVTVHDVSPLDHPEWFGRHYLTAVRTLLPAVVKNCVGVITVSEFSRARLAKHFPGSADKTVVIPNGVSDHFFAREKRSDVDAARRYLRDCGLSEQPYILALGSLEPRKNLTRLIEGYILGKKSGVFGEVSLLVVGGAVKRVFSSSNVPQPEGVVLGGYVPDNALPGVMQNAMGVAYVPLYEGFGLPPLEALASGATVVTSDIPPIREACADWVTYVDPRAPQSILDGLRTLVEGITSAREVALGQLPRWESTATATEQFLLSH